VRAGELRGGTTMCEMCAMAVAAVAGGALTGAATVAAVAVTALKQRVRGGKTNRAGTEQGKRRCAEEKRC